jgi:hypothetical protein
MSDLSDIAMELAKTRMQLLKMRDFVARGGHIDYDHVQGRIDEIEMIHIRIRDLSMKGQPMQATRSLTVTAKRIPATDRSGSKIVAKSSDGKQITIPYPHQSNEPHEMAVRRLYPNAVTVTEVATSTERAGLKFFVEVPA